MKKFMKYTGTFLTVLLVCTAIMMAGGMLCGCRIFNISSASMSPSLPVGTLIVTRPVSLEKLEAGDIVTVSYNASGQTLTHRVVSTDPDNGTFITKGDANETSDSTMRQDQLVGKVILAIPGAGNLLSFLAGWKGRLILASCLIAALVLVVLSDPQVRRKQRTGLAADSNQNN